MPSALDVQFDTILAALTAQGAPFATGKVHENGRDWPIIETAPPHLALYFAASCATHKEACFLVDGTQRLSFGETYALAQRVAVSLVAHYGVKKGDRVGLVGRNSASWVVLYMGIIMAGGVATLLNGFWQGEEMAEALSDTGCALVFADVPRTTKLAEAQRAHATQVITFDETKAVAAALAAVLAAKANTEILPSLRGDDFATILFTSGSTGKSKGALSSHRAKVQGAYNYIVSSATFLQLLTQMGQPPKYTPATLMNVPLFHITGELTVLLQSFALGRKLVMIPKWDALEAMRLIEAERITYFTGVPLMSYEILNHPERAKFDLSSCSVIAAGGALRPVEHVRRLHEEMPLVQPVIGYGLTETNAMGATNFSGNYLAKPESTGRASAPLVEIAVLDDAGQPVEAGVAGEICIRSIANFSGYWQNEVATVAAVTADGFLRSGDIGRLDADGYLTIIDRKKDMIVRGGEKITSIEVEAALYAHPEIAEACVFGMADARYGEVAAAVVMFQLGKALDIEVLKVALGKQIAAFKVPAHIWVSGTPLPRLGTGKIDKVAIRAQYSKTLL